MPSFTYSPTSFALVYGEVGLEPVRFGYSPAAFVLTMGSLTIGPNLSIGLSADSVRLDRLLRAVSIGGPDGPSMQFQAFWQKHCEKIEAAFQNQQGQIDTLEEIVAGLQAAQQAAAQANQGVDELNDGISLSNSSTDPVDGLLSATSSGVITIAAHERVYTAGTTETRVSVDAGSISGFASGQFIRVYYNDPAREGGAVTYLGTTDEKTQVGDTHIVGGVTIPQAGSPPSEGQGSTPPGYVRPAPGTQIQ